MWPGAAPDVGPVQRPARHAARTSAADVSIILECANANAPLSDCPGYMCPCLVDKEIMVRR
jgi:hypothetical protein